jgi:hypothetical protein
MLSALVSQLLGALGFCVVVACAWRIGPEARIASAALLAVAALWVFAGGGALRGSVMALGCCAALDLALALLVLANTTSPHGAVHATAVRVAPLLVGHLDTALAIIGGVAALAALGCVAAFPQVRRMAAWQEAQLARIA